MMGGSGISRTICKSLTPAPRHSFFTGWMLFLTPNQQHQSTEGSMPLYIPVMTECHHHHTTTTLRPFFWDHPGELVPEKSFWTL